MCLVWCANVCFSTCKVYIWQSLAMCSSDDRDGVTVSEIERRTEVIIYVKGEVYLIPNPTSERLIPIWWRLNQVLRPNEFNAIGLHCFECPTASYRTLLCCVYVKCTQGDNQHYRPSAMLCPQIAIERCMSRYVESSRVYKEFVWQHSRRL